MDMLLHAHMTSKWVIYLVLCSVWKEAQRRTQEGAAVRIFSFTSGSRADQSKQPSFQRTQK